MSAVPVWQVTLTATFTADPLLGPLARWREELGAGWQVALTGFNQVFQELLDPTSVTRRNTRGLNVLLLQPEALVATQEAVASEGAKYTEIITALGKAVEASTARWFVVLCAAAETAPLLHQAVAALAQRQPTVAYATLPELAHAYALPVEKIADPESDRLGRIPFTPEAYSVLAAAIARQAHVLTAKPTKVVAVDADNTLWRGVVGEVGVEGVVVDDAAREVQETLRRLRERGLLVTVVSKNRLEDVRAVFARHPEMVLREADITAWKCSWQPKSQSLRELAEELSLGLDSFVFLDDNPVETAEVAAHMPEVVALTVPGQDAAAMRHFLAHVWAFDTAGKAAPPTSEDAARTEMYRAQASRAAAARAAENFEAFLASLELVVDIAPAEEADVPRLAQLTQRTNQFNAVGVRRNETELALDLATGLWGIKLSARDRFGDYGLVGFVAGRAHGVALEVEHFLLSCRALGKRVEHRMIEALTSEAVRRGAREVQLPFFPTERNEPVARFLDTHFSAYKQPLGEGALYKIPAQGWAFRDETVQVERGCTSKTTAPASASRALPMADFWQKVATTWTEAVHLHEGFASVPRRPRPDTVTAAFRAPTNAEEARLTLYFSEVLGVAPVGVDDDFFQLGGQSLLATRVLARLARETGRRLPLRVLFDFPTAAALAAHLATLPAAEVLAPTPTPRPRDQAAYPLSAAQRRMWFLDRYTPGNIAYHIVATQRAEGPLQVEALRAALEALAAEQESLRARFPDVDGHPTQVFTNAPELLVRDATPADREAVRTLTLREAFALAGEAEAPTPEAVTGIPSVQAFIREPFSLTDGPLVRLLVLRLDEGEHLLTAVLHHIIADGWSMGVFFQRLSAHYRAALGMGTPPAAPSLQTYDLAVHQEEAWHRGAFAADLAYWREALRGSPEALNLPTDFPRPAERTYAGGLVSLRVPSALVRAVDQLAHDRQATPFMIWLAAWQALLWRWSGQDDILVGTPVAGRTESASEDLIGCFINTLVLRAQPEADRSFADFLADVRERSVAAFAHQELPFDRLVEALDLRRSLAHSPLFQVMFVLQNGPSALLEAPGLQAQAFTQHNGSAKFDLVLEAVPQEGGVTLNLEYNAALFREDSAKRMLSAICRLLEHATRAPETSLAELELLSSAEKHRLLFDFNQFRDAMPPPRTIHEWVEQAAHRFPNRLAVTCEGQSLTYAELDRHANQLAHLLRSYGVGPGTPVAICLERSLGLIVGLLGILKAGGAYLPIDLSYPAERLAFMLEDAAAPLLITQRALAEKLPPHQARVLCLDDPSLPLTMQPAHRVEGGATADDLIYIIYTSGSTGRPKGCCLTHRNVTRLFRSTEAWFGFNENDVWTLFHSYAFDFSVWEIWGALIYGGRVVVVPHLVTRSPEDFVSLVKQERVTVLNQTPSAFRQFIAASTNGPQAGERLPLRYVIFGGEALEMQSLQPWFARHGDQQPQLVNMYGITETTVHVTYRPLSLQDVQGGSVIGVPIPDLRVYILDSRRQPCPVGVPGELYVGGAGVARGYLNREDLTAERFIPSPFVEGDRLYRTGDLARFLPNSDIEYLGRIDRQVKIRGFRIELGEIESTLLQHPAVREVAVLARDGASGKQLAAWLVTHGRVEIASLQEHLRRTLPDYMVPAAWCFVERFPLTANGKLDTAALPAPEAEHSSAADYVSPTTPAEQTLAAIWERVLRVPRVGRLDNFFSLGGDSILSIQVISQARQSGWPVAPRHLFENQTLAEFAACAEKLAPVALAASSAQAKGDVPLTPIQHWFAAQRLADPHYWNQAFLLELRCPLEAAMVREALDAVLAAHDAFRLRWTWEEGCDEPRQSYVDYPGAPHWEVVTTEDLPAAMERAHRAMNITTGPVFGAVLAPGRLFLCAHHAVIDGVSWRIVLEDLEAALSGRALAPVTASYQEWSRALREWAEQTAVHPGPLPRTLPQAPLMRLPQDESATAANVEASVVLVPVTLSTEETTHLLSVAPTRLRARVDELLVASLALALRRVTGDPVVAFDTEGHGREDFIPADVSRTVGWFTAMYPVVLDLSEETTAAEVLAATKDQWRALPHRGLAAGAAQWLMPSAAPAAAAAAFAPAVVFNYLGQLDGLTAGSECFTLSADPVPPWHGPINVRAHAIEIDAFVRGGQLRAEFRFSAALHPTDTREAVIAAFSTAVREVLDLQRAIAPSDFPLVKVSAAWLKREFPQRDLITAGVEGQNRDESNLEDLWPLSPMQRLLVGAAASRGGVVLDQWHCQLHGPLEISAFLRAWDVTLQHHSLLRASLAQVGSEEAVLVVPRQSAAVWRVEDWSGGTDASAREAAWQALLAAEARQKVDPHRIPPCRFVLVRFSPEEHRFLWLAPDWMLDGWSWPVVFQTVAEAYAGETLAPTRSYRDYLAWLAKRDASADEAFWREELTGFRTPTPLPLDKPTGLSSGRTSSVAKLEAATWAALNEAARAESVTSNALLMAAWALLLARAAGEDEVVFGAAFNGRPTELPGVETMAGPFTTNLPVRLRVDEAASWKETAQALNYRLFAASEHQHVSPLQVEEWSEVPWRERLFDSLVVFQNFQTQGAGERLSAEVSMSELTGPVHGTYALTLLATPRAEGLELELFYHSGRCSTERAQHLLRALTALLEAAATGAAAASALDAAGWFRGMATATARSTPRAGVPPRTSWETKIHAVWARAFGPHIGVEDNFFDAGGHSLLVFRVLAALRRETGAALSAADLFQYPTIAALGRKLDGTTKPVAPASPISRLGRPTPAAPSYGLSGVEAAKARAARARAALGQR